MEIFKQFEEKLNKLPTSPGVYLMKDVNNSVIYIGKAKNIKNRVNQYFRNYENHFVRIRSMISKIFDFDYIMTDTEVCALILECNLIKKYLPKYNVLLKDSRNFPYIKLTLSEDYPRIVLTRKVENDGSKYFGPFLSNFSVECLIEIIREFFKIRSCNKIIKEGVKLNPCLDYHLGFCSAPCAFKISHEEYRNIFYKAILFLKGKTGSVVKWMRFKMKNCVNDLEFEKAKKYKNKIETLICLENNQKMFSSSKKENIDIIGLFKGLSILCVQIFYMRDGKVVGSEYFLFDGESSKEEVLTSFIKQFYFLSTILPREILIPFEIEELESLQEWLQSFSTSKVKIIVPKKGEKLKLLEIVNRNAAESTKKIIFKNKINYIISE
ncbi:MAG: excinuclease ABC subunit UvrC [Clostridiales bacterium]|jgi:excinuclease ABC subunit C|nr:excinuclease ABC subunit UvrC [Clostridiales bacterium]